MEWFSYLPREIWERIVQLATTSKNLLSLKFVSKRFKALVESVQIPMYEEANIFDGIWNVDILKR